MDFFKTLEKYQHATPFIRCSEMHFYLDNVGLLNGLPQFKGFLKSEAPFDVIRANIILRGIQNKQMIQAALAKVEKSGEAQTIEEIAEKMDPFLETLPYLRLGKNRIFIPIFPPSINRLYDGDYEKFEEKPYNSLLKGYAEALAIDPFDAYGVALYDSYFTKLIPIAKNEKETVFLDFDSHSLFCVTRHGRLNVRIALFDRYLRKPYLNHMLERVAPVANAYLNDERETMIDALVENGLISRKLIFKIYAEERKVFGKVFS